MERLGFVEIEFFLSSWDTYGGGKPLNNFAIGCANVLAKVLRAASGNKRNDGFHLFVRAKKPEKPDGA